jgi:ATP-dependent Clp protease ATP-binding subunit ClpA
VREQQNALVGWEEGYKGAQPGVLTGFVEKNPNAVLLFDEIEKAHLNTIVTPSPPADARLMLRVRTSD